MDLQLNGKRAIVTGGSSGIGRAIARGLAAEGCAVAIVSRSADRLSQTAAELTRETGGCVVAVVGDTADDDNVRQMTGRALARLHGVDILVNAAAAPGGANPVRAVEEITTERLLAAINDKVQGYVRCAQACIPVLRAQGWGRIINISGISARLSGSPITSMRNAAVVALTKSMADELGPSGINVTAVHPGLTRTERVAKSIAARSAESGRPVAEVEADMANNCLGRVVLPEEVADVVAFLASPRSVAINGDVIAAGGGVGRAIHF